MKRYRGLIIGLCVSIVVVLFVHTFVARLMVVPQEGERPVFHGGDRLLISCMSYGIKNPLHQWVGEPEYASTPASVGHWVAFHNPIDTLTQSLSEKEDFIGYCFAAPGDTIWLNTEGKASRKLNPCLGCMWPLVIPSKGTKVDVSWWNAQIYGNTINIHEQGRAQVIDGALYVNDVVVNTYCFQNDYYWMTMGNEHNHNDSRVFGFVPDNHLIGRICYVLYSIDRTRPLMQSLRSERIGLEVASGCPKCVRNDE